MSSQIGVVLFSIFVILRSNDVESYSKVFTMGAGSNQDGPKVYKALNMDLIFPKTFNSSDNVISTTQTPLPYTLNDAVESLVSTKDEQFSPGFSSTQTLSAVEAVEADKPLLELPAVPTNHYHPFFDTADSQSDNSEEENEATLPPPATGRAVDYRPAYPFSQLLTPNTKGYRPSAERSRPVSNPSAGQQHVVYPSYQASRTPSRAEINKLSGKGTFSDRFTPAEGVASNTFKIRQNQNRKPSISRPIAQTSNKVASFVQSQDIYAFPPNINSRYPAPTDIKQTSPSDTITSYLPPAAGPLDNTNFVGPVNPDLLPESMKKSPSNDENGNGYQYNPPEASLDDAVSDTDSGNVPSAMNDSDSMADDGSMDMAPAVQAADDGMMDESPPPDHDPHTHDDHHDIGGYVDGKEYPTPPPGYLEEQDHDHHHHHPHPDIEFSNGPYFHDHHTHDYPDIVFDDYHDHHDHHIHHDHHPLPMTTEPPPPPPEPEQPRVKKYSYFYIGRKLWYIPLYFTVWFTFYVLWLILKSIARHKVNLPNHYVTRRNVEDLGHREARETIDKLTVKVMDGIENFKLRYMG